MAMTVIYVPRTTLDSRNFGFTLSQHQFPVILCDDCAQIPEPSIRLDWRWSTHEVFGYDELCVALSRVALRCAQSVALG